jgi:hypothetical protein
MVLEDVALFEKPGLIDKENRVPPATRTATAK